MIFFHGFRLPAIASSSEAGGDEAVKPQFRFSGKMVEEATTDGFLCVLCELCERIIFYKTLLNMVVHYMPVYRRGRSGPANGRWGLHRDRRGFFAPPGNRDTDSGS
jgi:hypothetical protein